MGRRKLVIIIGGLAGVLGMGGIIFPETIGDILNHYLKNVAKNQEKINSSQNMTNSPNSTQQRAGRDSIMNNIEHRGDIINNHYEENKGDRKTRNQIKEEEALRKIRESMIDTLKIVNDANMGVSTKKDLTLVNQTINDYIRTKMKYEIDVDKQMLSKFNEVMGAFRKTANGLYQNLADGKVNQSLKGLDSYTFIDRVNEADAMIKERLFKN